MSKLTKYLQLSSLWYLKGCQEIITHLQPSPSRCIEGMPREPPATVSPPSYSFGGVQRYRYTSQTSWTPVLGEWQPDGCSIYVEVWVWVHESMIGKADSHE